MSSSSAAMSSQLIPSPFSSPGNRSSLFSVIEIDQDLLRSKGYNIVRGINSIHPAFFISMREAAGAPLSLRGYQREAETRHLTIDKFFRTEHSEIGIRGYLYAHYTERYSDVEGNQIIVHVYFNQTGNLITIKAKRKIGDNEICLDLRSEESDQIRKNAKEAYDMLRELLSYKSEKYTEAVNEAARLDVELVKLSFRLRGGKEKNKDKERKIYFELADKFLAQIECINLFSDLEFDGRGNNLKRTLKALKREASVPSEHPFSSASEEDRKVESEEEAYQSDVNEPSFPPKPTEKTSVLSEIRSQERELDKLLRISKLNINEQIRLLELVRDLRENLLALNFEEEIKKLEEVRQLQLIDRIENKIKKVPDFLVLLKEVYKTGDLENFKKLFSFDRYRATSLQSLMGIISFLPVPKEGSSLSRAVISICDYLFENSENYRQFMFYPMGRVTVAHMCCSEDEEDENVFTNLLILAMKYNRPSVFNMLLDHGYHPDNSALAYKDYFVSGVRACIAYSGSDEEAIYLKTLLEKGASVNKPRVPIKNYLSSGRISGSFGQELLDRARADVKLAKEGAFSVQEASERDKLILEMAIDEGTTDLVFACKVAYFSAIPALLTASASSHSLFDLAVAIGALTYRRQFKAKLIIGRGNYGLAFAPSTDRKQITELWLAKSELDTLSQVRMFISPTAAATPQCIEAMQRLYDTFLKRYPAFPLEVPTAVEKLINLVKNCVKTQDRLLANQYYRAALLLIIQKGEISEADARQIILLENYMASLYRAGKDPKKEKTAEHCQNAVGIAESLGHARVLKKDPYYLAAKKILSVKSSSGSNGDAPPPESRPTITIPLFFDRESLSRGMVDVKVKWEELTTSGLDGKISAEMQEQILRAIGKAGGRVVSPSLLPSLGGSAPRDSSAAKPVAASMASAASVASAASAQPAALPPPPVPAKARNKKKKKK